jgi:hypothetical protein
MVDEHREGQLETCRANGLGVVKNGHEVWTKGPRSQEDRPWVASTWGHQQVRVHVEE